MVFLIKTVFNHLFSGVFWAFTAGVYINNFVLSSEDALTFGALLAIGLLITAITTMSGQVNLSVQYSAFKNSSQIKSDEELTTLARVFCWLMLVIIPMIVALVSHGTLLIWR